MGTALAGMTTVGATSSPWFAAACLALLGLGTGVFISPNSSALLGAAPQNRQGTASAVMAVSRSLGMLVGVASATALFRSFGGQTGRPWTAGDFEALRVALGVAAFACLAGAVVTFGRAERPIREAGRGRSAGAAQSRADPWR